MTESFRAVDNQIFVATVSPARDVTSPYVAWGHSTLANPDGSIAVTCEEDESIVYGTIGKCLK